MTMRTDLEHLIPILMGFLPFFDRFFPIFMRLLPLFDRFFLFFVSYFLERILRTWKTQGLIDNYGTRTMRTAKLHYKMEICIVLTTEQTKIMLNDLLTKVFRRLRASL
jgi:hypothetical protein